MLIGLNLFGPQLKQFFLFLVYVCYFEKFHKMNIIDPSSSLPCKTSGHGVAYSDCFELYEEENKFIENYLKKLF